MAISAPHSSFTREPSDCDGMVKRDGWTTVSIDASTWICPAWKCDKCGATWWSYFDNDNGDEAYDLDDDDGEVDE